MLASGHWEGRDMDAPLDTSGPRRWAGSRARSPAGGRYCWPRRAARHPVAYGTFWLGLTAAALCLVLEMVREHGRQYEVTEERLIIRRGIFVKSIDEIELYRIKDVRIDFTISPDGRHRPHQRLLVRRDDPRRRPRHARHRARAERARPCAASSTRPPEAPVREIDMHVDV